MREGRQSLFLWPGRSADVTNDSKTPAFVKDPTVDEIRENCVRTLLLEKDVNEHEMTGAYERTKVQDPSKLAKFDTNFEKEKMARIRRTISSQNELILAYRKIPAAFLELEFPNYEFSVLFEDVDFTYEKKRYMMKNPHSNEEFYENLHQFSECNLICDYDFDNKRSNPVEEQYSNMILFTDNFKDLQPKQDEAIWINKILAKPHFELISKEQKFLIWKYRYYLSKNKDALPKFLHSVNWSYEKEAKEAFNLLTKWEPIDYEDALHLISSEFCANEVYNMTKPHKSMMAIRSYGLHILQSVPDERINFLMLQLVQALRYEPLDHDSELEDFLINRVKNNITLAITFYWHLQVEISSADTRFAEYFKSISDRFIATISSNPETKYIEFNIKAQGQLRENLITLNNRVKPAKDRTEELKRLFASYAFSFRSHFFCLDPTIMIDKFEIDGCRVFKSAMAPVLTCFKAHTETGDKIDKIFDYKVIFKNGDDLRQDMLVLQVINLINTLLKSINIDLKLSPYRALACSREDGFLEFVPESKTVQEILKLCNNNLDAYLKQLAEKATDNKDSWFYKERLKTEESKMLDPTNREDIKYRAHQIILENYIDSCAGYCVITYILGIGDRHLENLLMNDQGKFFHVDFGYILGTDPKKSIPFKLRQEMVDGMGQNFEKFKKRCVSIYQYVRSYSKLIMNLFDLMMDAGLQHVNSFGLQFLWEKFHVDMNNEEAEKLILRLIEESRNAIIPVLVDMGHKWVSNLRN